MRYVLLTISLLFLAGYEGYGQQTSIQRNSTQFKTGRNILTGGSTKQWKYTLKRTDATCPNEDSFHADNIYTFHADQRMEFNPGTITEAGNCGDLANLEGRWEFSKNMDSLRIIATQRKGGQTLTETTIISSKIISFSADRIQLELIEFTPVID